MILTGMTARPNFSMAEIRILAPAQKGKPYRAALRVEGWREFPPRNLHLDLARLASQEADPQAYGKLLGRKLFAAGGLGADYRETLAVMQSRDEDLHLRLAVEPAELQAVRWERVYQPIGEKWQPLAVTADTPFCRQAASGAWARPAAVHERPLRMLVVISSPEGIQQDYNLAPIAPSERRLLRQKLDGRAELSVTYLESGTPDPPTLNALRAALQQGVHLIHFLCHGALVPAGSVLFLEKDDRSADPVTAGRLAETFSTVNQPPLFAFLAACESARFDTGSPFQPLGLELVTLGGAAAALAMFDKVSKDTAHAFAGQFYTRLFLHGMADAAANEARQVIQERWDWGAPVLFSRLEDNQLIDFPVGQIYANVLEHNDQAFEVLRSAQQAAQEQGLSSLNEVNALIKELSKSHRLLADLTGDFRRLGRDPATFAQAFEPYYYQFKGLYDGETWTHAGSSCFEIGILGNKVMQTVGPYLKPEQRDALQQELKVQESSDFDLLKFFREFLDQMDAAVENIWTLIQEGRPNQAVQARLAFEAQISPSLRRSKAIFDQMMGSLHYASKA
ncbi:ureidoglycolate hydrolase [Longilinea arvoryzae]|uniref:Ureidoglycolate hydrolase n=1 Tax=Longilinea arvoryzae TaxID=360412 RepID=A0A0S7BNG8_9CHLR|nr:CHAT domain-containing protein [Longilinea arvoryzae]GAP15880.1 ureidoglycolate hydrolase [Longilinea arvoryzae]